MSNPDCSEGARPIKQEPFRLSGGWRLFTSRALQPGLKQSTVGRFESCFYYLIYINALKFKLELSGNGTDWRNKQCFY